MRSDGDGGALLGGFLSADPPDDPEHDERAPSAEVGSARARRVGYSMPTYRLSRRRRGSTRGRPTISPWSSSRGVGSSPRRASPALVG